MLWRFPEKHLWTEIAAIRGEQIFVCTHGCCEAGIFRARVHLRGQLGYVSIGHACAYSCHVCVNGLQTFNVPCWQDQPAVKPVHSSSLYYYNYFQPAKSIFYPSNSISFAVVGVCTNCSIYNVWVYSTYWQIFVE